MIYIPKEWLRNVTHEKQVSALLETLDFDLVAGGEPTQADVINELQELKEDIMVEKIREGSISFGA